MTETQKTKGSYKRPSRLKAIVPLNFDYVPPRMTCRPQSVRPRPLRDLFALREKLRTIDN